MIIYEYYCTSCGEAFEVMVARMGDAFMGVCPSCGSEYISKKYGKAAIHYNGNGFYSTDHREATNEQ